MALETGPPLATVLIGSILGLGNLEGFVPKLLVLDVCVPSNKICSKKLPKMPFLTESVMYWHPAIRVFCDC